MSKEQAYFATAKAVSELSNHPHQHLGCVLVQGHRIISSGYNSQTRHHSLQAKLDKQHFKCDNCQGPVHAEFSALIPFLHKNQNLGNATLYVYREHKDGTLALARPCPRCMQVIKECGIRRIRYTTDDGYAFEKIV